MSSNQRKSGGGSAALQISLGKLVAEALNTFTEVEKEKFQIQAIVKMTADIAAIVGKNCMINCIAFC